MRSGFAHSDQGDRNASWLGSSIIDSALAIVMVLVVVTSGYLSFTRNGVAVPQSAKVAVATSGQTLWSLAEEHPVHGLDTAETVALIRLLNSKTDSGLKPGEAVIVPISSRGH